MKVLPVKLGDQVKIISGDSKGKTGKVIAVSVQKGAVKVGGVALCLRHKKAKSAQEKSGIVIRERFIAVSKVKKIE